MTHLYIVPDWFFGIDIAMEILFGLITFAVALSAYKIHKISQEKSMKHFGIGFFLISLSYIAWAAINFLAFSRINNGLREITLDKFALFVASGLMAHMLLLAFGLVSLVYATLAVKRPRIYYLLLGLTLLVVASSYDKIITFRIVSVFLLSYMVYHFFVEWRHHESKNLLCSFIAFILLLLSSLDFAFSTNYYQAYVIGHLLELGAYLLILKNLITVKLAKSSY